MKLKKVLITLVASVGLIATAATVNKNEEQTVKADGSIRIHLKHLEVNGMT